MLRHEQITTKTLAIQATKRSPGISAILEAGALKWSEDGKLGAKMKYG
jgi:hypothetical protein